MNDNGKSLLKSSVPLCLCDSVLKRNDDKGVGIFNTEARSHRDTENDGIRV